MTFRTIGELMQLTRDELCKLNAVIEQSLGQFEAGTVERLNALESLRNIRCVMTLRGFHFS